MARPESEFRRKLSPLSAALFLSVLNPFAYGMFAILFLTRLDNPDFVSVSYRMLLLLTASGVPSLLLAPLAGRLADRVPKRYAIILARFGGLLTATAALFVFSADPGPWGTGILLFLTFSMQAVFSPAFYSILPETFPEEELSQANGTLGFWTYTGAMAGLALGFLLFRWYGAAPVRAAVVFWLVSLGALICSFRIQYTVPETLRSHAGKASKAPFIRGCRELWRRPSILLAALGDDLFLAIGAILPFLLLVYGEERFGARGAVTIVLLQAMPVVGFGIGSYAAGRLSARKIEPGLVPFGAMGMALAFFLAAYFPGPATELHFGVPGLNQIQMDLIPRAMCFLFLAGLSGGLFVIPLRTYCQQRFTPAVRGAAVAANNALGALFLLFAAFLVLGLQSAGAGLPAPLPTFAALASDILPSMSAKTLLVSLGLFTFLVTLVSMWALPDFALRFLIISCGNTIYRIRIDGAEHIPPHGPVLLLSNHVSYADSILISACTSRRVRFLMRSEFLKHPLLRFIARLTKFITIPDTSEHTNFRRLFDTVRDALRAGEIVCVFPEGEPTQNSLMREFKRGFLRMIPPEMDIPVIPVHIGDMWGSQFSHYAEVSKSHLPLRARHSATVTFGEAMPAGVTPFQVRARIAELAAATASENIRRGERPLHAQLAYNAKRHPFRTIIRDADGKSLTVFKTFLASLLLSRELRRLTDPADEYIGVLLPNSSASALSMLAVLYADKVPCPLNFTTPLEVFENTVRNAGIRKIVTSRKFLSKIRIPERDDMIFLEDVMPAIGAWKKCAGLLAAILIPSRELLNLASPLSREDVSRTASVLFSSGSTGNPKGIVLTHHNINSDVHSLIDLIAFDPKKDAFLGNLPLFHSFGLNTCFWIPVSTTCPVTYVPAPLDGKLVGEVMVRDRLTIMFATPSFLQTYLRKCTPADFAGMRLVITGAEKLRADTAARFREFTAGRLSVTEGYGCTELSPVVSVNVPPDLADLGRAAGPSGSIGAAVEDTASKVVDPITFRELPPGSEGLLFIRGPMVMRGYLNEPEKTASAMHEGYYNTGDIVTMDAAGRITICGRLSRFSKIAGEMVPHEMVEGIINEMCGHEIRAAAVGSIPDPQKGEALLVLYTPEMPFTPDQIVAELRERSISNLWIPKAVNFYPVPALPLLGSGKLDLALLRNIADRVAEERKQINSNQKESAKCI